MSGERFRRPSSPREAAPSRPITRRKVLALAVGGFTTGVLSGKYAVHELSYVPEIKDGATWREGYRQMHESAARGRHEIGTYVTANQDGTVTWQKPLQGKETNIPYEWDNFLRAKILLALGKRYARVGHGHTHPADRITAGARKGALLREPNPPSLSDIRSDEEMRKRAEIPHGRLVNFVVDSVGNLWYYRELSEAEVPARYRAALDDYLAHSLDLLVPLERHIARHTPKLRRTHPHLLRIRQEVGAARAQIARSLASKDSDSPDAAIARDRAVRGLNTLVLRSLVSAFPSTPIRHHPLAPFWERFRGLAYEAKIAATPAPSKLNTGPRGPDGLAIPSWPISPSEERANVLGYLKEHALVRLVRPEDVEKEPPLAGPDYVPKK